MNQIVKVPANLQEALGFQGDAFTRKVAIIDNYLRGSESYLVCGYFLTQVLKARDWENDGSEARNFVEWTECELGIKRSNAQRMMSIWNALEPYIQNHSKLILAIDFSKLALISPLVAKMKTEEEVVDILHAAKSNSVRDLTNNIKSIKGGIPTDACDHNRLEGNWRRCLDCGAFIKTTGDVK